MKKIGTLLILVFLLIVAGCGNNEKNIEKEVATQTAKNNTNITKEQKSTATFKDGVLETKDYTLKIFKSEVIKSPMEEKKGLFVTFKLTNKSDSSNIVPDDTIPNLIVSQENDTSKVELADNYYFLDAFGGEDDTVTYNKMVELDNASANELLPGKTVNFVVAYGLDNDTQPVTFTAMDLNLGDELGTYKVVLKK